MKFYFAPLEGVSGYLLRNSQHIFFENADKYFTPFITTNQCGKLNTKEVSDILPENNEGLCIVPQILSNNADYFIKTSETIKSYGYDEINLNLGCPSGTVVSKNRGSGFLSVTDELDRFLDEIFSTSVTKISIKTRLGKDSPDEFYRIMDIYNKYPLEELIIHPRIRTDYYKNKPNLEMFSYAMKNSKCPVCYNGDLFTREDYVNFTEQFPEVDTVMVGRGVIANPALIGEMKLDEKLDMAKFKEYHDTIFRAYMDRKIGDKNVLFKMKELWSYMYKMFPDSAKCLKKVRKTQRAAEYESVVASIFANAYVSE